MRIILGRLVLVASALALVTSPTLADSSPITGLPPLGSFAGGPFDAIDLADLNVHFAIPVFGRGGIGIPFGYALGYESLVWIPATSTGGTSWVPVANWGWRGVTQAATGYVTNDYIDTICSVGQRQEIEKWTNFVYHDASGTSHPFPANAYIQIVDDPGSCTAHHFTSALATDNSGYTLKPGHESTGDPSLPTTIVSSSGITIIPPDSGLTSGNGSVTDPNGNTLTIGVNGSTTTLRDTLGTTALTIYGNPPNTNCTSSPVRYVYTAPNAGQATVTVSYQSYAVQTNFQVPGISEFPAMSQCLVDRVTLPDSTFYQFAYETTGGLQNRWTGRLQSVTLPTGGTLNYWYSGNCLNNNQSNCMMADGSPSHMAVAGTSSAQYWRGYQVSQSTPHQTWTTTYDYQGNQTNLRFSGLYETERIVWQGWYQGQQTPVLDHSYVCYNGMYDENQCIVATVTPPITWTSRNDALNSSSLTQTTLYSGTQDYFDTYGNVTLEQAYDYGTHQTGHTLLKQVSTAYNPGLCSSLNECNRPNFVQVQDGGGAQKGLINYTYDAKGNTIQMDRWIAGSAYLTSRFSYNSNGTLKTATDPNGTVAHYDSGGYSCNGAFPNSVSVPSQFVGTLTTRYGYNCTGGVVTSVTDPNSATVSTTYSDPDFWRPASTTDPMGNVTYFNYYRVRNSSSSAVTAPGQAESVMTWNGGNSTTDSLATPDSYGRSLLAQTRQGPTSAYWDTVQNWYDGAGRIQYVARPFQAGAGQASGGYIPSTGYTYDTLGRLTDITDFTGVHIDYSYNANDTKVVVSPAPGGENVKSRQLQYDALGRLASVCEVTSGSGSGACSQNTAATGYFTGYSYDPLGDLTGTSQSGQVRSFNFDGLGRVKSEANPESGTTNYVYDSDGSGTCSGTYPGDKVRRTDAANNNTCYSWDGLHRLTAVTYRGPGGNAANTQNKYYTYDVAHPDQGITATNPLGRLVFAYTCCVNGGGWGSWSGFGYDNRGTATDFYEAGSYGHGPYHTVNAIAANGAVSARSGYLWDSVAGRNISAFTNALAYSFDGEGRQNGLTDQTTHDEIWAHSVYHTTYNPAGQPDQLVFLPSTDAEQFTWDPNSGRMTKWQSNLTLRGMSQYGNLTWNTDGTLGQLQIHDDANSANNQTCSYGYDDLARLANVNCGSNIWKQNFSYDVFGNIAKTVPQGSQGSSFQATYNTSTNRVSNLGFSYDADGNVLNDNLFNMLVYDAEGRQVNVNAFATLFDAFNRAVALQNPSGYYQVVYAPDGYKLAIMNGQSVVRYTVPLVGGAQAVYTANSPAPVAYWRHGDWLGSSRLASTRAEGVFYDGAYAPFGENYAETGTWDRSFTGQQQDTTSGLYDFRLRQLSSNEGRWLVPDPAGLAAVDPTNPQTWNRYAYVGNDPLTEVDPSGLCGEISAGIGMDPNTPSGQALISLGLDLGFNVAFPYAGESRSASAGNIQDHNLGANWDATQVAGDAIFLTAGGAAENGTGFLAIGFSGGAQANLDAFSQQFLTPNGSNTMLLDPGLGEGSTVPSGVNVYRGTSAASRAVNATSPGGNTISVPGCGHDANCLMNNGTGALMQARAAGPCANPMLLVRGQPIKPLTPPRGGGAGGGISGGGGFSTGWQFFGGDPNYEGGYLSSWNPGGWAQVTVWRGPFFHVL